MKNKKIPTSLGIVSLILLISFGGYILITQNSGVPPEKTDRLSLGISQSFLSIPIYIADAKEYFAEEGLDVTIEEFSSGKAATESMLSGEMDISTVADMPVIFNSFKRDDFCTIATFTTSYTFVSLLTHNDSAIKSAPDLRGKRVGANTGTSSHFYLAAFLLENRLTPNDIEMIHYETVDLPDALKNREVDVISVWQPYAHQAIHLLNGAVRELPAPDIYRTTFGFAVKREFAKSHQTSLEKFLKAFIKASAFIQNNREESQQIIAESLDIERETVNDLWDGYDFQISLDQSLLVSWDNIARWAIANTFTNKKTIPNYLNYLCLEPLDAADPKSITIIR